MTDRLSLSNNHYTADNEEEGGNYVGLGPDCAAGKKWEEAIKIKATENIFEYKTNRTNIACIEESADGDYITENNYHDMQIILYMWFTCDSVDLKKYDTLSFSQVSNKEIYELPNKCKTYQLYNEWLTKYKVTTTTTTPDKQTVIQKSSEVTHNLFTIGAGYGKPCTIKINGTAATIDDCVINQLINEQIDENFEKYFFSINQSGLSTPDINKDYWYSSGVAKIVYNDWTGTVTYSGPTTPPSYEVSYGDKTYKNVLSNSNLALTDEEKNVKFRLPRIFGK